MGHGPKSAAARRVAPGPPAHRAREVPPVGAALLGLRFLLELGALVALGWWAAVRVPGPLAIPAAVALPALAAVAWGRWVAPRASRRLPGPARFAVESAVWVGASLALADLRGLGPALAFAALAIVTAVAARRYEPAPPPR